METGLKLPRSFRRTPIGIGPRWKHAVLGVPSNQFGKSVSFVRRREKSLPFCRGLNLAISRHVCRPSRHELNRELNDSA